MSTMDDAVLGDLGLSDAPDDPNMVPDGTFKAVVHEMKMFTHNAKEAGKDKFLIITYRIVEPEPVTVNVGGRQQQVVVKDSTVDEWKSANKGDSSKQKSFLKQRLLNIGVSKEDVDAGRVNFKGLCGTPVMITVKNKDGFTNVNKVVLADDRGWNNAPAQGTAQQSQPANSGTTGNNLDF